MASAHSLRSFMRPTVSTTPRSLARAFTTTPLQSAAQGKSSLPPQKQVQVSKKHKKPLVRAKAPNPGERKAFRKRIQLSNNSALEVQGTEDLQPDTMLKSEHAGKMFSIPNDMQDKLRTLEAFKTTQSWNLFRKPHILVRQDLVDLMNKLEAAKGNQEALRLVLTGTKLSGKSHALLQAMLYGMMNNWVVINIPEAQDLTNGNTEYTPVPETSDPYEFIQPVYCYKLLTSIYDANKSVLEGLKLQKDWSATTQQKGAGSLADLIQSAREPDWAWPTFMALWQELQLPGRPPVLFALDGLSHINKKSDYRDPEFNPVHAHDLVLVRTFVDALSGKTKLPNGGAVIAATSGNNRQLQPSQELVLSQLEAGQKGDEVPKPDPYEKGYDERVYDALKNSTVMRLEALSKADARVLMEYWGASGMLRRKIDQHTVWSDWALSGHGIVGELERTSLLTIKM
ncbi:mitochondrial ribosomal death-associated protein 3-domain-containing protein [Emericellopsis atlantica]|uniref:Small ribosomal subunit protein mS29 n=1 Tax=Emericellopsis atlantica TaxID=2614577 RepID=A0A9P8CKG2_9HYPO|nr:mitochondrial ribosomal death-associated protein 3-domain-containing protein [Emericellopsis atlantica]KAG9249900.1 mitochondrial ribosomal death-associated protein 3-domain-containing protein [Emericellopsis atlantica]